MLVWPTTKVVGCGDRKAQDQLHQCLDASTARESMYHVVIGSPQKTPEVTNWLACQCCRCLNLLLFSGCFRRIVREQSSLKHHPLGDALQDSTVLSILRIHGMTSHLPQRPRWFLRKVLTAASRMVSAVNELVP